MPGCQLQGGCGGQARPPVASGRPRDGRQALSRDSRDNAGRPEPLGASWGQGRWGSLLPLGSLCRWSPGEPWRRGTHAREGRPPRLGGTTIPHRMVNFVCQLGGCFWTTLVLLGEHGESGGFPAWGLPQSMRPCREQRQPPQARRVLGSLPSDWPAVGRLGLTAPTVA